MAKEPRHYRVEPGSDLAVLLRDAERDAPVQLGADGRTYRLIPDSAPEGEIWRGYDAEKVLAAFRAAKGAFKGLDSRHLLTDIHAQRGQDGLGRPA